MAGVTVSTKRNRVYPHKFDHDLARVMRKEGGLSYNEIAREMGVSIRAVQIAINPDQRARDRANSEKYQRGGTCIDCGKQISSNAATPATRCSACAGVARRTSSRPGELYCSRCDTWKPDEAFAHASNRPNRRGRHCSCTPCLTKMRREYRANLSPEKRAEQAARDRQRYERRRAAATAPTVVEPEPVAVVPARKRSRSVDHNISTYRKPRPESTRGVSIYTPWPSKCNPALGTPIVEQAKPYWSRVDR